MPTAEGGHIRELIDTAFSGTDSSRLLHISTEMNLNQLDVRQLEQLETRLFDEFTELDQLIADKQRRLQQVEALLMAIAQARRQKEDGEVVPRINDIDLDADRAISPPIYIDERHPPPEDPSASTESVEIYRSGPFHIRRNTDGMVDAVQCDLGQHFLVVEKETETSSTWHIREKPNPNSVLACMSLESLATP